MLVVLNLPTRSWKSVKKVTNKPFGQSPPGQEGAVRLVQPTSYLASKDLSRSIDSTPAVNNEMPPKLNRATRAMRNAGNKEQTYLRNRTVQRARILARKVKEIKVEVGKPKTFSGKFCGRKGQTNQVYNSFNKCLTPILSGNAKQSYKLTLHVSL